MDRFFYEIVAASDGQADAARLAAIIEAHRPLADVADPWPHPEMPSQTVLFAVLVVVSHGLATDPVAGARVAHASALGFPVIPVVEDRATYDFANAPLAVLTERNAEAFADPERLVRTLLHHAGVELFDGGGHVFISYARSDGSVLAEAVHTALSNAGIGRTLDVHAFPGGELIQSEIRGRIRLADLVVLIDSKGAARSRWVADELDLAMAERVPVIAVTPIAGAFHHSFETPHVEWSTNGGDAALRVVSAARRVLGRKTTFRARVARTLGRLSAIRAWSLMEHGGEWHVRRGNASAVTVACTPAMPVAGAVSALRDRIRPGRALLVAGIRPFSVHASNEFRAAGGATVAVTSLPTFASRLPARLSRRPLKGCRVFLSGSMPTEADDRRLAERTLADFVVGLVQALVDLGATVVFGGHPSVTPLVHRAIEMIGGRGAGSIELHQGETWRGAAELLDPEVREGPVFRAVQWHGLGRSPSEDVDAMRTGMIRLDLDAAVFVGGKLSGFTGPRPGIVDEHARFVAACADKPAFVVGLAGGAARTIPPDGTRVGELLHTTADPDIAVALIVAELLGL